MEQAKIIDPKSELKEATLSKLESLLKETKIECFKNKAFFAKLVILVPGNAGLEVRYLDVESSNCNINNDLEVKGFMSANLKHFKGDAGALISLSTSYTPKSKRYTKKLEDLLKDGDLQLIKEKEKHKKWLTIEETIEIRVFLPAEESDKKIGAQCAIIRNNEDEVLKYGETIWKKNVAYE